MEWSNDLVLEFLDLYQKEPVIWNPSHNLHKNRNEIHDAWRRIQAQLSATYSVTELKKKKDSLMASFRTCKARVKKTTGTGGAYERYKPNWFAYAKMDSFLKERDQARETINTENMASQLDEDADLGTDTEIVVKIESDDVENEVPCEVVTNSRNTIFKSPLEKKRKLHQDNNLRQKMNEAFRILKKNAEKEDKRKDACDIYGELLATNLREMDERTRTITMNKIDNIIFEMKMNYSYRNESSSAYSQASQEETSTQSLSPFTVHESLSHSSSVDSQHSHGTLASSPRDPLSPSTHDIDSSFQSHDAVSLAVSGNRKNFYKFFK